MIYDVIFGSIATLLAAVCTYLLRNHKIACTFPPVIFNMIIVPFVLVYAYGIPAVYFHGVNVTIPFNAMTVGIGEVISVCVLGSILMRVLAKYKNVGGFPSGQKISGDESGVYKCSLWPWRGT